MSKSHWADFHRRWAQLTPPLRPNKDVAEVHAFIRGRAYVTPDDIKALGLDVLRHRVILTYRADAEGVGPDALLGRIFEAVPVP